MRIVLTLFAFLLLTVTPCISQQQILLIGTQHHTSDDKLDEIVPIKFAIEKFQPEVFCVEYLSPNDTLSLRYRMGDDRFTEAKNAGQISDPECFNKIKYLQTNQEQYFSVEKHLELQQLYYHFFDHGNSEFETYRLMNCKGRDSLEVTKLSESSQWLRALKSEYEIRRKRNNEYIRLVFPLAAKLKIPYVYPIDDLSTWGEYEKYFDKLNNEKSDNADIKRYRKHQNDFFEKINSPPYSSNLWVYGNSPLLIHDLLYVEGYLIDSDVSNNDIKKLHFYWMSRNRLMAKHIDEVAQNNQGKRIVVFFGMSHVGPVLEELKKLGKNYELLTLFDLPNKN